MEKIVEKIRKNITDFVWKFVGGGAIFVPKKIFL